MSLLLFRAHLTQLQPPKEYYNCFFNPNVCHVCKAAVNLIECPWCNMISYCSESHRILHYGEHKEICQAIVNLNTYRNMKNFNSMTLEEWTNFKKENLRYVKNMLYRNLEPYEKQMFLFAKSCIYCRKQNNLITVCTRCLSINLCVDHYLPIYVHDCEELSHCFSLDKYTSGENNRDNAITTKYLFFDKNVVHDMVTFILAHMQYEENSLIWTPNYYNYADEFSKSLTLIYGMQRSHFLRNLEMTGEFVVHVIAGSFMDIRSQSVWEIVLHEFPQQTRIIIVIINSEVKNEDVIWECCTKCKKKSMELHYEYYCMLYHDYVDSSSYVRPHVIIGFDIQLRSEEMCAQTIKALQRLDCLVILTAKSESIGNDNIKKMREILGLHVNPFINEPNLFASFRPYRDEKSDSVYYSNHYIIIYEYLYDISNAVRDKQCS